MNLRAAGVILAQLLVLIGIEPVHAQSPVTGPLNNATSLPVGSCSPTIPCSNGACCNGNSGYCGFGPAYCTPVASGGNCTSNCNAQAECGPYAPPANLTCPLNVCCSQYGFCGTTTDFCGTGCVSNCGNPIPPSCGPNTNSALTRRIGYYSSAAASRSCMAFAPEQIYTPDLTHINFAFASISDTFRVVEANPGDSLLWQRTTNLRSVDPTLSVFLSIGGWNFNDPPTSTIFSQLVASTVNTRIFLASVLSVMETYAFDGIDVDWEYPGAYDRGGGPADKENYVTFMATVKAAFSNFGFGLSFTAPSSYWYLQNFDLPGLLKSADWVNVMTYDLHGVWDGTDPYVGSVLDAHTNLTEIDEAFNLYWRAGVNPSQVTMGFAFYGRSFTLASSACGDPGCAWVSGGNPGPCSVTSGVLMFAEIEDIFNSTASQSVLDPVAAVNYMTWDTNQWVSYDNAESFAMKMNYANDHCIGGSMIWSVDQDDTNYDALSGLYGNTIQSIASGVSQITGCLISDSLTHGHSCSANTGCLVTDWNVDGCPNGYSFVGSDQSLDGETRFICCESGNAPSPANCDWFVTIDSSVCVTVCPPSSVMLATSTVGCISGSIAFCCKINTVADVNCDTGGCSTTPTCPAGNSSLLVTTLIGSDYNSFSECGSIGDCPGPCSEGEYQPLCCDAADFPYQNCQWTGTPPLCLDGGCAVGQITLLTDIVGDGTEPCIQSTRSFCCDPIGDAYVPVPFNDIFPSNVIEGAETFDVEFDPDVSTSPQAGTSSGSTTNDNEETEAFGEVFIDSPNPWSISSLAVVSDWVVTSCDPKSDQPQTVLAYCSKSMENSGCAHVFVGGAEHTIVQMPRPCGLGPYARVANLVPHANQSILSAFHQAQKPASELVYSLSIDYDFSVIPSGNGPIYMRADVTDMNGYWDSVVDSPPERKRWLQEQESKKPHWRRWWGAFTTWLSKLTTVQESGNIARTFSWSDTWTIYQNSVACPGSPTQPSFEASLDITVAGRATANAAFGFYLEATIVPPSVQAAYLYLNTDASAYAEFTIQGLALVEYDSSNIQFASFGFPGLYYPGLLTIGPSFAINGYVTGEISLEAILSLSTQIQFPSVNIQLGAVGDTFTAIPTDVVSWPVGIPTPEFGVNVALSGDVSLHLVPALQLGINILNGALVDAQAFVQSDLYAGVSLNGSASLSQTPEVCYNAYFGVDFYGGLTGSLLYWEGASVSWPFYQNEISLAQQCMTLGAGTFKRDVSNDTLPTLLDPLNIQRPPDAKSPAYIVERNGDKERYIYPARQQLSLDPPAAVGEGIMGDRAAALPCRQSQERYSALDPKVSMKLAWMEMFTRIVLPTHLLDAIEKRWLGLEDMHDIDEPDNDDGNDDDWDEIEPRELLETHELARSVQIPDCKNLRFQVETFDKAVTNLYYDLARPFGSLDPTYAPVPQSPIATAKTYNKEHIYEIQLVAQFIKQLENLPALWQNAAGTANFCSWVNTNILLTRMAPALASCLPNDLLGTSGPFMPYLEAVANGIKAKAFQGHNIRKQKTFNNYSPSKKVDVLRAAAGVTTYMNDPMVISSFIQSSQCIRGVWGGFDTFIGAGGIIVPAYNSWIVQILQAWNTKMETGINNMILWWNTAAGGDTALVNVVVGSSNYVTLNGNNPSVQVGVSGQMLQANVVNFATANLISWAGRA